MFAQLRIELRKDKQFCAGKYKIINFFQHKNKIHKISAKINLAYNTCIHASCIEMQHAHAIRNIIYLYDEKITSFGYPVEVNSMYAKLNPADIPITKVSTNRRPITRGSACTLGYIADIVGQKYFLIFFHTKCVLATGEREYVSITNIYAMPMDIGTGSYE